MTKTPTDLHKDKFGDIPCNAPVVLCIGCRIAHIEISKIKDTGADGYICECGHRIVHGGTLGDYDCIMS